ncbi:MAG: SET domain-containing protein [Pyrinomonadaceae bacterium]
MNLGSRRLVLKRTVTGLGLFTLQPIRADKRVIQYLGPIITTEQVRQSRSKYLFKLDEQCAIDGRSRSNKARYINHSCQPNAEAFIYGRRIWICSKRAIPVEEQITINYGAEYLHAHMQQGCKCAVCGAA